MLTLSLLRHAKSSWDSPAQDDFDRPLAARGLVAAPLMAGVIAARGITPGVILCSTSVRTRATLALVLPAFGVASPPVWFEDGLYLATASRLFERIRHLRPHYRSVMVIGHNPGLHDLAMMLVQATPDEASRALAAKFPTAGLAVLTFPVLAWHDVVPATGHLDLFVTPGLLKKPGTAAEAG